MRDETMIAAGVGRPVGLQRPLLPFSRAQLTATAETAGQLYADDPGNDDPRFERVRVRALLAALEEQGLMSRDALNRTAKSLRQSADQIMQKMRTKRFLENWAAVFIVGAAHHCHALSWGGKIWPNSVR